MRNSGKHDLSEKALTERILGFAINVHRALGPGLLESVRRMPLPRVGHCRDALHPSATDPSGICCGEVGMRISSGYHRGQSGSRGDQVDRALRAHSRGANPNISSPVQPQGGTDSKLQFGSDGRRHETYGSLATQSKSKLRVLSALRVSPPLFGSDRRMTSRRAAKIIATLGPASSAPEKIRALHAAGADLFRLN